MNPNKPFFPYVVSIGYFVTVMRKVTFRKHEKFSPVLGNQTWGLLHSTWVIYSLPIFETEPLVAQADYEL